MADVLIKAISIHHPKGLRRPGLASDFGTAVTPPFNIFQITGGAIAVRALFGHCTVASTGAAQIPRLRYNPVANPGWTWLSAAMAAGAVLINDMLCWSGVTIGLITDIAPGWADANTATNGFIGGQMILGEGTIGVFDGAAADGTLMVDWYISYEALSIDTVVAAV